MRDHEHVLALAQVAEDAAVEEGKRPFSRVLQGLATGRRIIDPGWAPDWDAA